MIFNTILLFSLLTTFTLCDGQNTSYIANSTLHGQHSTIAKGDTVSEIDKSIWIIFQAKSNNYWFGSDGQGVYRYDGKTITQFTTKDGLPNNRIREIQEDKSGNIYISTLEGISKFDGQTFTTLTPIKSNFPNHAWKLGRDDLWFKGNSIENGPYRYDGKSLYHLNFPKHSLEDQFYSRNPKTASSPYGVYTIYKDIKGNVWFGTAALGLCRYDGKSLSWMYEEHLTYTPSGGSFGIRSIIEDKEGKFWFCNTQYRYNVSPKNSTGNSKGLIDYKKEIGIGDLKTLTGTDVLYFIFIVADNKRDLWMATYGEGVWRYDGKSMTHYLVKEGSKAITLVSIYKDNRGDLWLGTHEAGAYKFNGKTFEKFRF